MDDQDEGFFEGPHEGHGRALDRAKGLAATDVTIGTMAFLRYVTGSIENTTGQEFSYLVVLIDLLDANGRLLGNVVEVSSISGPAERGNLKRVFQQKGPSRLTLAK